MRPRDRIALVLVALSLAFATLALGGAPRWAAGVASLLAIATAVPYATSRRTSSQPSVLLFPLAVAAGLTLVQLIPLPIVVAEIIAPSKLELVRDNAAAWKAPSPRWVLASFDPPATLVELAKLVGYLALAYTATRLASVRRARHWLAATVAGVAVLAALVTLVHHALGLSALYGVHTPSFTPHILGPLLGVNHLASLLALAVPVALALAVSTAGVARLGWLAGAATLIATTLLTGSRGGVVGLIAGLVVAVAILLVQRRAGTSDTGRPVRRAVVIPAAVVATCAVVLLAMLTAGDVARDLSKTSFEEVSEPRSKYQVWTRSTALIDDNQWLGVGKGGFEPAFARVSEIGDITYSHAENAYLQAVLDWGVPGAALLALALLTAVRVGARRWRQGALEAGALGGLAGVLLHDLADFSTEIPAVAMLTITTFAILLPARLGTANEPSGARAKRAPPRVVAIRAALLTAAAAVVAVALSPIGRTARDDHERAKTAGSEDRLATSRAALARHPSDHILAGRAAEALFERRDPRAIRMIGRALAMHPTHPGLHHLAARMLARSQRPEQSAVEFAAATRWTTNVTPIVLDVLQVFPVAEDAARALSTEPTRAWSIVLALGARNDVAVAYCRRYVEDHPRDPHGQAMLARTAIQERRPDLAVPAAQAAWDLQPLARHGRLLGVALHLAGRTRDGIALLEEAAVQTRTDGPDERVALLFSLAELQVASGDFEAAKATLSRAAGVAGQARTLRANVHLRMAAVEDRLGNRNGAAWERQQARALTAE